MNISKNFLPKDVFKTLKDSMMGYYFPWYFNDFVNREGEKGDNFHVYTGLRHQMFALEDTELFEFSTQHFDEDSYRIIKGD